MDALAPAGSAGWLRNQVARIRYKPGWAFRIDDRSRQISGWGRDEFVLIIEVTDPNRRLNRYRFRAPRPDSFEDEILQAAPVLPDGHERCAMQTTLQPQTDTVDWLLQQVHRAVETVELQMTRQWLRYEDRLVAPPK